MRTSTLSRSVSAILPIRNARAFLARAVSSALEQPEVAEVILVDDGSTDGTKEEARRLAEGAAGRVRVLNRPVEGPHGAGLARNDGISAAACDWIAFLDTDDYWLPGRFSRDAEVLASDSMLDGVYDALGIDLSQRESGWWRASGRYCGLVTFRRRIPPEHLFERMNPIGIDGAFSTDAVLVHRRIFEKTGCMFGDLSAGEDTVLWLQMAVAGRLAPGRLDRAVAVRGVHGGNSVRRTADAREVQAAVLAAFDQWAEGHPLTERQRRARRLADLHLSRDWSGVCRIFREVPGIWRSLETWRHLLRWCCVRQFPEDPAIPGFLPGRRRRQHS